MSVLSHGCRTALPAGVAHRRRHLTGLAVLGAVGGGHGRSGGGGFVQGFEGLTISATELNQAWDTSFMDAVGSESPFLRTAHGAADKLQSRVNSV